MQPDVAGFLYPTIDANLCVNCGICVHVCPVIDNENPIDSRVRAYYGASLNPQIVKNSSSGGAFTVMSDSVLSKQGLVCGVAFDYDNLDLVYKSSDNCTLDELRRSKYIASNPQHIFKEVLSALESNRLVLFCGLACHIDGLNKFLKKNYSNLITCDLICGGTASPHFFREHIKTLEKKYKSKIIDINFRAKLYGWKEHSLKIKFENGKEYATSAFFDSFFLGYFEKPYQRDSCYKCKYRLAHKSDIIIADYWGGLKKKRCNNNGVSMIITNSHKGENFFQNILNQKDNNFIEMPLADSDYVFKTEKERYSNAYKAKKEFLKYYEKYGFEKAARKTYFKGICIAKFKRKFNDLRKWIKL